MENKTGQQSHTFHLGIAMAGAVSAGAYTAGVLDYLFETLERWEKEKGKADVPSHQVVIDVMGGASAGGMCAALAPLGRLGAAGENSTSLLKNLWVNITGADKDIFDELLKTDDIKENETAVSFLNSNCIDQIGESITKQLLALHASGNIPELPGYFNQQLQVLLTLFNVSGLKFKMEINSIYRSEKKAQYAFEHRDMAHFKWDDTYTNDGLIPLWERENNKRTKEHIYTYVQAAKATGAFPIGLSPRKVKRRIQHIRDNEFIAGGVGDNLVFDSGPEQKHYESLNADGGTANNEPLELIQKIIKKTLECDTDFLPANCGVILVDPFPAFDTKIESQTDHDKGLRKFAMKLLGAMRSQLLFDAKNMVASYKKKDLNSFMIAPAKTGSPPDKALACGGLGGFSGFINKHYREHDYHLGRRNCQQFLRYYFVVKPGETTHDAVIKSYTPEAIKRFAVINETEQNGIKTRKVYLPIVPDTLNSNNSATNKIEPKYMDGNMTDVLPDKKVLFAYKKKVRQRLRYVLRHLFHVSLIGKVVFFPLFEVAVWLLPGVVLNYIYKDLKERGVAK